MDDWQFWAIMLGIFLIGLILGTVTRSPWSLLVPPAVIGLWLLVTRDALGGEIGRLWRSIAVVVLYMVPGVVGVVLGIATGRRLARRA